MNMQSVYLNLEDDVARVVARIKKIRGDKAVLVCPKRCQLFSDSINLRLLKKQTDLLGKEIFVLTMDEKGQMFAKEAGFQLKFLPKAIKGKSISDIQFSGKEKIAETQEHLSTLETATEKILGTVKDLTGIGKKISKPFHAAGPERPREAKQAAKKTHTGDILKVKTSEAFFPKELSLSQKDQKEKGQRSYGQKLATSLIALSLVLILVVVLVILPKATIVIYPKSEPLTRDFEIGAGVAVGVLDANRLAFPAVPVEKDTEISKRIQSQGKKEIGNKAAGYVKIYNFTGQPLNLKQETTVLTLGEKFYRLGSDIVLLKPTQYKDAQTKEIDENSLDKSIEIVAAEGGESFNLPAGTRLEITNQVFGSRPQLLYARSETAIDGGTSRYLSFVSEDDLKNAQEELTNILIQNLRQDLSAQNLILVDKAYTAEPINFETDKPVGTESPSFNASLKLSVKGLAFNNQELQKLILERINQTLSLGKELKSANWDLNNIRVKALDLSNGVLTLLVHFEAKSVSRLNLNSLKPELKGKSLNQVNEILESKPEIDRIDVHLAPFWQKNFPWFSSKITIETAEL